MHISNGHFDQASRSLMFDQIQYSKGFDPQLQQFDNDYSENNYLIRNLSLNNIFIKNSLPTKFNSDKLSIGEVEVYISSDSRKQNNSRLSFDLAFLNNYTSLVTRLKVDTAVIGEVKAEGRHCSYRGSKIKI